MWVSSVDPIPSRISTPNRSRKRENSSAGSASPADTACRRERTSCRGCRRRPAPRRTSARRRRGSAGAGHQCRHERRCRRPCRLQHGLRAGREREGQRVAETVGVEHGRDRQWRSPGCTSSTSRAYPSHVVRMSAWRCIASLGRPVVPEVQSQKHGDSAVVSSTCPSPPAATNVRPTSVRLRHRRGFHRRARARSGPAPPRSARRSTRLRQPRRWRIGRANRAQWPRGRVAAATD